jgi:hypothetical protein
VDQPPDTGSVIEDLVIHAEQNLHNQVASQSSAMGGVLARTIFEPDVYPVLSRDYFRPRHEAGLAIVGRGLARGDLPPSTDGDLIIDTIAGLTLFRHTLKGGSITAQDYRDLATRLVSSPPLLGADAPPLAA